jgi:hypothetical protein
VVVILSEVSVVYSAIQWVVVVVEVEIVDVKAMMSHIHLSKYSSSYFSSLN